MTRNTVSPDTRAAVLQRAAYRCEVCGGPLTGPTGYSVHHRTPRGMGGSKDPALNRPGNLLALCGSGTTGCHGRIESNRAAAYLYGWLVRRASLAAEEPVRIHGVGWCRLSDDGTCEPCPPPEGMDAATSLGLPFPA